MEASACDSTIMARLTISAIERSTKDHACWKEPSIHKAILVSGLSVLIASIKLLEKDLTALDDSV